MSVPQSLPNLTIASSASRYSRTVDLTDLNSVHTLAVLAVPSGSFVLDIGAADGSVARALAARGCRVWGIEIEPEAARAAERVCERVFCGDVAQILDGELAGDTRFDVVLALDVLEHLVDPAAVLARVAPLIAPGGRLVASIPNVAHGAVRLQLLNGTFARTGCGLLDETHLHFFDRGSMRALLRDAGFVIRDELRTRRGLTDTEIPIDPEALPSDAVRLATDAVDAETYQFFVIAAPATAGLAQGESLLEVLQGRAEAFEQQVRQLEGQYRQLEGYTRKLEAALADAQSRLQAIDEPAIRHRAEADARDQAQQHVAALERHLDHVTRLHAAALDDAARLRDAAVDAAALSRDLADARLARAEAERRADELRVEADAARRDACAALEAARRDARQALDQAGELRRQLAHLRREVSLRDAHLSELRGALDAAATELPALRAQSAQLVADAAEHAAQRDRAVAGISGRLQACDRERAELQAALDDVRRIPRYRLADAVNSAIKRLPTGHRLLKRLAVSFMRRPRP